MKFSRKVGHGTHNNLENSWWRHQMETFSALLAICAGNSPVPGEFPTQRPVMRSFDVCFDLRPNKRLSKQFWGWWLKTQLRPLWRHRNVLLVFRIITWIQECLPTFSEGIRVHYQHYKKGISAEFHEIVGIYRTWHIEQLVTFASVFHVWLNCFTLLNRSKTEVCALAVPLVHNCGINGIYTGYTL